jgi:DNA-binding MarR family transcriptional regulator
MLDDEVTTFRAQIKLLQRRLRTEVPPAPGLSRTLLLVLRTIERLGDQAQPSQVAADLQMTSSNVAAALRELVEAGLVVRERDATDARKVQLSVTVGGSELLSDLRAERDSWLGRAVEALLDEREQQQLLQAGALLERLARYEQPLDHSVTKLEPTAQAAR